MRTFTLADQQAFAHLSGDINPIHMGPDTVIHGINLVLWALAEIDRPLDSLKVRFVRFVKVGDTVSLRYKRDNLFEIVSDGAQCVVLTLGFGGGQVPNGPVPQPAMQTLDMGDMAGRSGTLEGGGLASLSTLVGMVCPGLYSIFAGFNVEFTGENGPLNWQVVKADERFRMVTMAVEGGGLKGTVDALVKFPPVQAIGLDEAARLVAPGEFAHVNALVIGGARGLGAATVRLLEAGGAKVAAPTREQHDALTGILAGSEGITDFFYFPTPAIFGHRLYSPQAFSQFAAMYLDAFADHVAQLVGPVNVLWPSTVALDERPSGLTEYAMAKAAGEILCADLQKARPELRIFTPRLPRVLTDQTAVVPPVEAASAAEVMLPIIREMQG